MVTLVDNITFLPNPYKEEDDIVIHRVTGKETIVVFTEIFQIKKHLKRERRKRRS